MKSLLAIFLIHTINSLNITSFSNQKISEIIFQSYLRYFQIDTQVKFIPSSFKLNKAFLNDKNIPSKFHFYFELTRFKESNNLILNIYTCEKKSSNKILTDSISLNTLETGELFEDLKEMEEGFCFAIKYIKNKILILLELCADTEKLKNLWIQKLKDNTVRSQNNPTFRFRSNSSYWGFGENVITNIFTLDNSNKELPKIQREVNFISPKSNSSFEIEHETIYLDPEPKTTANLSYAEKNLIHQNVFDHKHPQKFIKCIIKEGDILFQRSDIVTPSGLSPLIPVRLSLTNKEIVVKLSFKAPLFELPLKDLVSLKLDSNSCFLFTSITKSTYKFCEFDQNNVPRSKAQDWIDDIILFKYKCNGKLSSVNIESDNHIISDKLLCITNLNLIQRRLKNFIFQSKILLRNFRLYKNDKYKVSFYQTNINKFFNLSNELKGKFEEFKNCENFKNLNEDIKVFYDLVRSLKSKKVKFKPKINKNEDTDFSNDLKTSFHFNLTPFSYK